GVALPENNEIGIARLVDGKLGRVALERTPFAGDAGAARRVIEAGAQAADGATRPLKSSGSRANSPVSCAPWRRAMSTARLRRESRPRESSICSSMSLKPMALPEVWRRSRTARRGRNAFALAPQGA